MPAVRGPPLRGRRHRRRAAAVSRRAHPVRRAPCATATRRSGSTTATASSRRLGPGRRDQPGAGGDRRVHVRASRGDRAHRPARRALPDGLRGRRLVPARVAGRASRAATSPPPGSSTTSRSRAAPTVGERERDSQRLFWERWSDFFDGATRRRRCADAARARSRLRIVYVTEDTGVGGGHRDIFEHLNRLADRGHDVALYTLGDRPTGFDAARRPCTVRRLRRARRGARAARRDQGRDVVDDRRPGMARERRARHPGVLRAGHRDLLLPRPRAARATPCSTPTGPEFRYMTISSWNRERLRELGPRRRADPAGDRPAERSARARTSRAARTWCSRSGAPTR